MLVAGAIGVRTLNFCRLIDSQYNARVCFPYLQTLIYKQLLDFLALNVYTRIRGALCSVA